MKLCGSHLIFRIGYICVAGNTVERISNVHTEHKNLKLKEKRVHTQHHQPTTTGIHSTHNLTFVRDSNSDIEREKKNFLSVFNCVQQTAFSHQFNKTFIIRSIVVLEMRGFFFLLSFSLYFH